MTSKLFKIWASVAVFFAVCWASDVPVVPGGEIGKFDLEKNGTIVAKIEGIMEWRVRYEEKTLNFSLPNDKAKYIEVSGEQTEDETRFVVTWKQGEKLGEEIPLIWTAKFTKNNDGSVSLDKSLLKFTMTKKEEKVEWEDSQRLTSNSSWAYNCSQIETTNKEGAVFTLKNVRIQPFDLKDEKFGEDEICPKDRSTTPAPTTVSPTTPKPPSGNWTVSDDAKYTCIRLVGDLTLHLQYEAFDGKNLTAVVPVPAEAEATKNSTCNYNFSAERVMNNEQILQLTFSVNEKPWFLTINFTNDTVLTHDNSRQTVTAYYVRLDCFTDKETFPNITAEQQDKHVKVHNHVNKTSGAGALPLFKSDSTHYYRCNDNETTAVVNGFSLGTQNLKVEAFLPNTTEFQKEQVCPTDQRNEPTDLIPIIIGAALTALVVFVLIAYLVGRHRAKASTYETI